MERHVLRNFIFLHAIENDLPLPIGPTDAGILDSHTFDEDAESTIGNVFEENDDEENEEPEGTNALKTEEDFRHRATTTYALFAGKYKRRFRWLTSHHFNKELHKDLMADAKTLRDLLIRFGEWQKT